MMFRYTDEELIEGLRQRNGSCINYIYRTFIDSVRNYVRLNTGNMQDVQDVMQDTMMVLYIKINQPSFILNCKLRTYFDAISRNIWKQRLERKYRMLYQADCSVCENMSPYRKEEEENIESGLEMRRLLLKHISELPSECRRILELYRLKVTYREIAQILNYKNEGYVKTRKYTCKNLLRKRIMKDPDYRQFLDYDGSNSYKSLD